ncbi:serine/threonine-protein kinase [Solicola gregarius]|uniref:Serine/threonine protein kinase n=1 Tax=Solicola gregarius TaxID=2908642 RepID=A0AA46YJF4_9ACTN|nr:serine/threonine-protein kinase [Solicola gregarius]UYM04485.1 serine/threonine protein kinase [Solicola gregarius]
MSDSEWGFAPGDQIVPDLIAQKLLGGGEAYEAYLAFDEVLFAPVVVKVVRPDQVDNESTLRGLRREIAALDRLEHPAVVRYFHADADYERPYVALENIDGPRLSSLIRKHGRLPVQQLLPLGLEIASALHYLRGRDVIHLDIKPSNVIMGAPARLIDLSVARSEQAAAELTYPIGTDEYMAPEQCDPPTSGTPGFASDMWGLGTTLFHAAAGYRAFDIGSTDENASVEERFPQLVDDPYDFPDTVDGAVAKLILPCLDPDPAQRPTPQVFAEALEPLMAAMPKARLSGFKISLQR